MTLARREIRERHFVSAANFGIHLLQPGGESFRWKPFGHGVGIEKCLINFLGRCSKDAVKTDSVVLHVCFSCSFRISLNAKRSESAVVDAALGWSRNLVLSG